MRVSILMLLFTRKDGDESEIKWASLHSEQDRINKEKKELRKTMLLLAKAKSERKVKREELITLVSSKQKELDELLTENEKKKQFEEEKKRELALNTSIYDEGYGVSLPAYDLESESYGSNISIFGSFGRSSSESAYEEDFHEERWG